MTEIEQLKQELAATKQKLAGAQEWGQELRGRYDNLCLESAQIINVWALAVQELEATRQRLEEAEKHIHKMIDVYESYDSVYECFDPGSDKARDEAENFLKKKTEIVPDGKGGIVEVWSPRIPMSTPTSDAKP